jgi:hypothetical protein
MDDDRQQLAQEVAIKIKELSELDYLEHMLKNNVGEFTYNEKVYRVHKPNTLEKEQANKERMIRYFSMLKDSNYMFRKDLVKLYNSRGLDIESFDRQVQGLVSKENEFLKQLNNTTIPKDIDVLEKEIEIIRVKQQELIIEKSELMKYCIEQQLEDFLKMYLIYVILEVKNGEVWDKVYKSYDEFLKSPDDILQAKAAQVFAVILYHETI